MSDLAGLRARAKAVWSAFVPPPASAGEQERARAALAALAAADLLGFTVARARGGADVSHLVPDGPAARGEEPSVRALCTLRDELAYGDGLLDLMFVMQGLGSYPLQMGGRGPFADAVCADVIAGEQIAAYALTEPNAGSNLDEIATRAVRGDDGDWRLDGTKVFISNAGLADFYCVLARTSGEPGDRTAGGLTMFFVPASANGVTSEPFEVIAPHPIGEVRFDAVALSDDMRLGEIGAGLDLALRTLGCFRTTVGAAANGFARRALDESVRHLSERHQFGRPLGANQGLRFDLADMDAGLRAAQLLVEEAAALVDAAAPAAPRAVSRAKLVATETAGHLCDRAVQHHGGRGVKRGEIVESLYREVRALRIYEGASEVQKLILGKLVLADGAPVPPDRT